MKTEARFVGFIDWIRAAQRVVDEDNESKLATTRRPTTMPRLTSSLETVQEREAIPEALYRCRIKEIQTQEDGTPILSQENKNPMLPTAFEVVEGEYKGRQVFTNVMIGGKQKDGQAMNTFVLMGMIDAFKLPWTCVNCKNPEEPRPFLKGTRDNGLEKGKFYCPDCRTPARISYDPLIWVAANHYADVNVGLEDSKNRDGSIKRDPDGNPIKRNVVNGFSAIP